MGHFRNKLALQSAHACGRVGQPMPIKIPNDPLVLRHSSFDHVIASFSRQPSAAGHLEGHGMSLKGRDLESIGAGNLQAEAISWWRAEIASLSLAMTLAICSVTDH